MTLEAIIRNAKEVAVKGGYDQYIHCDRNGEYSFIRCFREPDEERKRCALFGETLVGVVKTKWVKGIMMTYYRPLSEKNH